MTTAVPRSVVEASYGEGSYKAYAARDAAAVADLLHDDAERTISGPASCRRTRRLVKGRKR